MADRDQHYYRTRQRFNLGHLASRSSFFIRAGACSSVIGTLLNGIIDAPFFLSEGRNVAELAQNLVFSLVRNSVQAAAGGAVLGFIRYFHDLGIHGEHDAALALTLLMTAFSEVFGAYLMSLSSEELRESAWTGGIGTMVSAAYLYSQQ
jgi:hypothetical protein